MIRGFAEEVLDRLPDDAVAGSDQTLWGVRDEQLAEYWRQTSAFHGIVTWATTTDPERLKLLSQEMPIEAGVQIVFHSWTVQPVVGEGAVTGVILESKEVRLALMAKVVADCTGDGDDFARAGGAFESDIEKGGVHHSMNTGHAGRDRHGGFRPREPEALAPQAKPTGERSFHGRSPEAVVSRAQSAAGSQVRPRRCSDP